MEQQDKARSSLKTKIFCAIGLNVVVLLGLLLTPGCKREQPQPEVQPEPIFSDTNIPPDTAQGDPSVMDSNVIQQTIVEPPPVPPIIPPEPSTIEYTIQKGDTYSTIAPKFNISVKALQAANPNVDPSKLQIGKKVNIPAPSATVAAPAGGGTVVDVGSGETIYTVKSGDTLGKLATDFHSTVKAIQSANGLSDTRIKVGQKLKIPAKSTTP